MEQILYYPLSVSFLKWTIQILIPIRKDRELRFPILYKWYADTPGVQPWDERKRTGVPQVRTMVGWE